MAQTELISAGYSARTAKPGAVPSVPVGRRWAKISIAIFMLSLLTPILINVGSVVLMPHRLLLLVTFFPSLFLLLSGRVGRLVFSDFAIVFAGLWSGVALVYHHGFNESVQPFGLLFLEFVGAYLLARVAIRSAEEFQAFVKYFLLIFLVLVPFAVIESITHQPVMLNLIPGSIDPVYRPLRLGLRRAQTIFAHPILFGVFVSSALGLFWFVIRPRLTRAITTPLVYIATICSLSTGALISVVVQSALIGYETVFSILKRRWGVFLTLAAVAYVVVDILSNRTPFHILVDYASFNTGNAYNRILIWQFGTQNILNNPIFGLGQNDWVRPEWMSRSFDNFWLWFGLKFGLPVALSFVAAVLYIAIKSGRATLHSELARNCRAGFLVSLAGIVVAGGTVHYWHAMMSFVLFFFGTSIWMFTANSDVADDARLDHRDEAQMSSTQQRYSRFAPKPKMADKPRSAKSRRTTSGRIQRR